MTIKKILIIFLLSILFPLTIYAPPQDNSHEEALLQTFDYLKERSFLINPIIRYSLDYGISPGLLASLIDRESKGRKYASGPKVRINYKGERIVTRAIGLTQLIPEYHGRRCNLYRIECNIKTGASYLSWCISQAKGNIEVGLKNYNSGPNSKYYYWDYIDEVSSNYKLYKYNYKKIKKNF
jgi:soluble lytic murein transglycosylase-like protein